MDPRHVTKKPDRHPGKPPRRQGPGFTWNQAAGCALISGTCFTLAILRITARDPTWTYILYVTGTTLPYLWLLWRNRRR